MQCLIYFYSMLSKFKYHYHFLSNNFYIQFIFWLTLLILSTLIIGISIYLLFWFDCPAYHCEINIIGTPNNKICQIYVDHKKSFCDICLDDLKSYPIGTHLNTTCHIRNGNYQSLQWYCVIVSNFLKLPLISPICVDDVFFGYCGAIIIPLSLWIGMIIFIPIKMVLLLKDKLKKNSNIIKF